MSEKDAPEPRAPRIVQFCTPQAEVIVALDEHGHLWQRERDQRVGSQPAGRPAYIWYKIAGPQETFDPLVEDQVDKFREALLAARPKA